jgi:hypothetical protein
MDKWLNVIFEVGWCMAIQSLVDEDEDLKRYAFLNRQPVEFIEDRSDVVKTPGVGQYPGCCVMNSL